MRISIVKGKDQDHILIRRKDGTSVETAFPHKGPFPHDAVHFAVESRLGLTRAFWGLVADGHHPDSIAQLAKDAGHASAKRAGVPDAAIVDLLQAERLVECFEADLWGGGGDPALLRDTAAIACATSHVPEPALTDAAIAAIRSDIAAMVERWRTGRLDLDWAAA